MLENRMPMMWLDNTSGDSVDEKTIIGSPNPWVASKRLNTEIWNVEEEGHPLLIMRDILLQWPGEETANLEDDERHARFVRTVTGYPLIDVGRVPFDWPMHPKSIEALKISEFFDNIASPFRDLSVRSAIMNADLHYRKNPENKDEIHRKCLAMVFKSLRDYNGRYPPKFIKEEIHFLATLHGTDNNSSFPWWPWKEMNIGYVKTYVREPNNFDSSIRFEVATPKQQKSMQDASKWKHFERYWQVIRFELEKIDIDKIEFVKIQSWIKDWCQFDSLGSTSQRILRGLSAIVESIISRIRHLVINKYGVGSIIIDGGGRIEFLVHDDAKEKLWVESIYNSLLLVDGEMPIHNIQARSLMKSRFLEMDKKLSGTFRRLLGEEFTKRHFPPFKITRNKDPLPSFERKYSKPLIHEECEICQNENSTGSNDWDERINNPKARICIFHNLLYRIGQATRKYDASIRKLGSSWKDFLNDTDRTVVAVSRIDLNSLGILFQSPYDKNNFSSIDIRRRRSFRFNAKWWQAVQKTIDCDKREIDSIAAWIAAGDDIVIAQYVFATVKNFHEQPLLDCLSDLDTHLQSYFSDEIDMELSFCAGYTKKGDNRDGKKDHIGKMIIRAGDAEQLLKDIWKTQMITDTPKLLMMNDETNELKKFCSKITGQGEKPIGTGKSMQIKYSPDFKYECQNDDKSRCKPDSECSNH